MRLIKVITDNLLTEIIKNQTVNNLGVIIPLLNILNMKKELKRKMMRKLNGQILQKKNMK